MSSNLNNATGVVICVLILSFLIFPVQADTESASSDTGPTLMLDYGAGKFEAYSAKDFMYFVPLVSPTPVDSIASPGNTQTAKITSAKEEKNGDSFKASYGFQMRGKGFHRNNYEPTAMIEKYWKIRKEKTLENMLDFIVLEGKGDGRIDVSGKIVKGEPVINEVKLNFNVSGGKSPVRIGIYSVKRVKDKFDYEKRYNETIVRVDTLSFTRHNSKGYPKMKVSVGSLVKAEEKEG